MNSIINNFLDSKNNKTINNNEDILSQGSIDEETIPDEDFTQTNNKCRNKLSIPNNSNIGPNINLKVEHKRYSNQKEKEFFFEKIKRKKKTELCKNYELYHDCYYKNNCCFAHGKEELRNDTIQPCYKTKLCKSFIENKVCNFGMRCSYKHIIK